MSRSRNRWIQGLLLVGIVLVALNLRPAITALSSLAERMSLDGIGRGEIGSLTTIPLLMFGIVSLWGGWIGVRIGLARALGLGLLVLGIGCLVRSFHDGGSWRLGGTLLIGAGIALGNVLLPAIVKSRFPNHVGPLTSVYSTAMNLGAAFGIALAVPLADRLPGGWNASLASWGWFAFASLLLWAPQMVPRPASRPPVHPLAGVRRLMRKQRAWEIAAFMGLQSMVFYSSVAWLPTLLQARGMTEPVAAGWVSGMQVLGCVASLVAPTLAGRLRSQSGWAAGCGLLNAASLVGILVLPLSWTGGAVLGLGLGVNASFGIVLLLLAVRSRDAETSSSLSSLAQSTGYLLAAPGPWLVGWLSETGGGWALAFGWIVVLALGATVLGLRAGREGELSLSEE